MVSTKLVPDPQSGLGFWALTPSTLPRAMVSLRDHGYKPRRVSRHTGAGIFSGCPSSGENSPAQIWRGGRLLVRPATELGEQSL